MDGKSVLVHKGQEDIYREKERERERRQVIKEETCISLC